MIRSFTNYCDEELQVSGLKYGKNVHIANDVIIHNPSNIFIGDNVRIDTQCVLIAGKNTFIRIGNNIHISAGCYYYGNSGDITLEDYTCTSARCTLYTGNDDYTEGYMTNSTVEDRFKKIKVGNILIKRHVVVGCYTVILPGVTLEYATSVGAHSLINKSSDPFTVIGGIPAKFIKERKNVYLSL